MNFPPSSMLAARPRFTAGVVRLAAVLALTFALTGCYESESIVSLDLSPDGRHLAIVTSLGQLGLFDIEQSEPMVVYSSHAVSRPAWSPDGRWLAFIERFPNDASVLWLLDAEKGTRPAEALLRGPAWKSDPVWLSTQTLALLTTRNSEDSNLWLTGVTAEGTAERAFLLLDHQTDISNLWAIPGGAGLVYQCMDGGQSGLWIWQPHNPRPTRLAVDLPTGFVERQTVAFDAAGRHLAVLDQPDGGALSVNWIDLATGESIDRLPLTEPVSDITVTGDGRIALAQGPQCLLWRPLSTWYQSATQTVRWSEGAPIGALTPLGPKGLAAVLYGSILLLAEDADELDDGRLHVRRDEDLLRLAWNLANGDQRRRAERLLENLWDQAPKGSQPRLLAAIGLAQLQRMGGHWRRADHWLDEAAKIAPPGTPERDLADRERLALAFFDARDQPLARYVIENMGPDSSKEALTDWVRELLDAPSPGLTEAWQRTGAEVRQHRYADAAERLRTVFENDDWTTSNLRGLRALLGGELEPLEGFSNAGPRHIEGLIGQIPFQEVLLNAARMRNPQAPTGDALSLLLEEWVLHGNLVLARKLVAEDLGRPADEAIELPYIDLLRQSLIPEERPRGMDRLMQDVLLEPPVIDQLLTRLKDPQDRLAVLLAATHGALVANELSRAQNYLTQAWLQSAELQPEAVTITSLTQAGLEGVEVKLPQDIAATAMTDEEAFRQIHDLYLMELYQGKISEGLGRWSEALTAYRACLNLQEQIPSNWDTAPYELTWNIGLIEQGAHDPEMLQSFLRQIKGLGDPLINPTHETAPVYNTLLNLKTTEAGGVPGWLAPHLAFERGMCYSLLRRPERALYHLRQARGLAQTPALRQRILLEEAALRDTLDQSALAARLYLDLMAQDVPLPVRAATAVALIQSEVAAGSTRKPEERLIEIMPGRDVPSVWREWLWMQVGGDLDSLDLYHE